MTAPSARAGGPAAVAALQAALAAENSAVYGYGVAGAHLAGARRADAVRNWVAHQNARDALTAMLAARGAQPVAAAAAYELPFDVHSATAAVALATLLEDRLSAAYLGLVGLTRSSRTVARATAAAEPCTPNGNSYAAAAATGWAPRATSIAVRASLAAWWATQFRTAAARLPPARCAPATP